MELNNGISMLKAFSPPPTMAAMTQANPAVTKVVFIVLCLYTQHGLLLSGIVRAID